MASMMRLSCPIFLFLLFFWLNGLSHAQLVFNSQFSGNDTTPKAPETLTSQVGILAVVNDYPITDVDLAYRINLDLQTAGLPNTNENRANIAPRSFDSLIFDRIKIQAGEEKGIRVTQNDLNRGLRNIAKQNGQTPTVFLEELRQTGVPEDTFFDFLGAQFVWGSLSGQAIAQQANVSANDINAEIARINSLRGRRERKLSEIFLPYSGFENTQTALEASYAIIDQLRNGTSFSDLARQFSRAPTAALGGEKGWIAEGTLDLAIENALSGMFAGQITETPVQAREGIYIIGIESTRPIGASNSQTLIRLFQLFRNVPQDQEGYDAQQDFVILNLATVETNNCHDFQTFINTYGDLGSGDMGVLDLSSLPPSISQALATLPENQPSAVLPVPNGGSVFMICERDERIDPVTQEQIEERLRAEREQVLTLRYERDLRRQAVIEYRF